MTNARCDQTLDESRRPRALGTPPHRRKTGLVRYRASLVPLLVLERRSLPWAVAGSFGLLRNVVAESLGAFGTIGAALCGVSLMSLIFGIVYGIIAPGMQLFWYPGDAWIAAAVVFLLTLSILGAIGVTVAGIALFSLYHSTMNGRYPEPTGESP